MQLKRRATERTEDSEARRILLRGRSARIASGERLASASMLRKPGLNLGLLRRLL